LLLPRNEPGARPGGSTDGKEKATDRNGGGLDMGKYAGIN
jgi:hypothetical protein